MLHVVFKMKNERIWSHTKSMVWIKRLLYSLMIVLKKKSNMKGMLQLFTKK